MFKIGTVLISILLIYSLNVQAKPLQNDGLEELKHEIVIHNLINGLYLDDEQAEFILSCAQELKNQKDELYTLAQTVKGEQEQLLLDLRKQVQNYNGQVDHEIARGIHQNKQEFQKARKEYMDSAKSKAQAVKAILTENQLYTIENFKPCLVPPKGSARIGQDNSGQRFEKLFERIRNMPDYRYSEAKYKIAKRHKEHLSTKFPHLEYSQLQQVETSFLEVLDELRSLSDVDFMIEKTNLAKKVKEIIPGKSKYKPEAEKIIAKFLLSEQIISVLENNLAQVN